MVEEASIYLCNLGCFLRLSIAFSFEFPHRQKKNSKCDTLMTNQDMMCYLFKRNKWFHGIKAYKFIANGVYLRGLNNTVSNEFNKNVKN